MSKKVGTPVQDALLSYISAHAGQIHLCSSEPATYSEATTTYSLAYASISSSSFVGPVDGTSGARKITLNAVENMTINNTGEVTHVAVVDVTNAAILFVTTSAAQSLTAGNKVTIDAFAASIGQPI